MVNTFMKKFNFMKKLEMNISPIRLVKITVSPKLQGNKGR